MTAPPFKLLGLDHLLLKVRDLAQAERFYCDVLGCTVKHRMPQAGMLDLSAGVTLIETAGSKDIRAAENSGAGANLDHFALLTSYWDEGAMREWLASNGVRIESERAEEDELCFYVRDPSGNLVELVQREGQVSPRR